MGAGLASRNCRPRPPCGLNGPGAHPGRGGYRRWWPEPGDDGSRWPAPAANEPAFTADEHDPAGGHVRRQGDGLKGAVAKSQVPPTLVSLRADPLYEPGPLERGEMMSQQVRLDPESLGQLRTGGVGQAQPVDYGQAMGVGQAA